jgi:uncharacterized protein YkwD
MGYDGEEMVTALFVMALAAPTEARALELRMFELINVERETRGIPPLSFSSALAQVARDYSLRMATIGEAHHGLDGAMEDRIREARPDTCWFGENVSKHTSIDYSLGDLLLSPGHRANLLSPKFNEIGVGIVGAEDGFLYITQEFARPCEPRGGKR